MLAKIRALFWFLVLGYGLPVFVGWSGTTIIGWWRLFDTTNVENQLKAHMFVERIRVTPPWASAFDGGNRTMIQSLQEAGNQAPTWSATILNLVKAQNVGAFLVIVGVVVVGYLVFSGKFTSTISAAGRGAATGLISLNTLTVLGIVGGLGLIGLHGWSWGKERITSAIFEILPVALLLIAGVALFNYISKKGLLQSGFTLVLAGLLIIAIISMLSGRPITQEDVQVTIPTNQMAGFFSNLAAGWSADAMTIATELFVASLCGVLRMLFVPNEENGE